MSSRAMELVRLAAMLSVVAAATLSGCTTANNSNVEKGGVTPAQAPAVAAEKDPVEQRDKAVQTRIQAGIESLKARDPERARRHISRAIQLNPDSAEALNAMALLYRYEGDDEREEEHYRKALRANDDFSQARNNYAGLLYRKGRYKEAIVQLERAADDTNYDQRAVAFLNLGRSYAKVEEYEKAASALQRTLRLDSTQVEAPLEMADVLLAQKKYAEARTYLSAYVSRARHTARSLWIGVRIEAALGDADKLSSYEFQLAKMFKTSPEYTAWQAWKAAPAPAATNKRKTR